MVEIIKIGNKTLVMDGKILSLFRKGSLLRQMWYGGYEDFDNANGGVWKKYINIPIVTIPSEYAQYLIEIDDTNVSVYNVEETLKAQASIASEFWSLVRSDGFDIRVFDHLFNQLWFWVEEFDYANKKAKIWVKLPENSEELNIAFGNEKASESSYNNSDNTFEFFDDFESYAVGDKPDYFTNLKLGSWGTAGGVQYEIVEYDNKKMLKVYAPNNGDYGVLLIPTELTNCIVETKAILVTHVDGDFLGLAVRTIDTNQFVVGRAQARDNYIDIWDESGRVSKTVTIDVGVYYNIKLTAYKDKATLYVDTESIQKTIVERSGKIGIFYGECDARYDFIMALKYSDPATFDTPRILEF